MMQRISDYMASWFKKEELPTEKKRILPKKETSASYDQKDMFFANMSHEIRTPVNGIVGFTQLLKETELSKEQHELVNTIHSSSMRLLGLVNDILDFSKINAHKMVLEETEFDLFRQIEDTIETYAAAAQEKDIVLGLYMDPTIVPSLIGDPSKLSQILINLVSNAVKFTDALGRVDVLVEKLAESQKTVTLRFSVKDTGIGIGDGAQKTIFNAFAQENSSISRKFGGTGLGLAISSELVKLMGGELALESEKEKGSEFYFSLTFEKVRVQEREIYADRYRGLSAGIVLPKREGLRGVEDNLKAYITYLGVDVRFYNSVEIVSMDPKVLPDLLFADERYSGISLKDLCKLPVKVISLSPINRRGVVEEEECLCRNIYKPVNLTKTIRAFEACLEGDTPSTKESIFVNRNFRGSRALVVDDNTVNQKLMMQVLENMQLDVELASDGAEALMHYMSSDFDILFMDIQMPVMDGLEAAERIIAYEKEEGKSHTPIIALTGNTESTDMQKYSDAGMDGVMSKPIDMTVMVSYLNQYLATQKLVQQIGKAEVAFGGARVLVIEENSINQKLIEQALASKGVESVLVNRAGTFMDTYRNEVFDMIFVSASMPMTTASKIIQDIRFHEKKKELDSVPIIVLVPSDTSDVMCENYRKFGAQDCLLKPLEIDEIKLKLDRHMQTIIPKQEKMIDGEVHVERGEKQAEDKSVAEPVGETPTPAIEALALGGLATVLSSEEEAQTEAELAEENESDGSSKHQREDEEPLPMLKEELDITLDHEISDHVTEENSEKKEMVRPEGMLDLLSEAEEEIPEHLSEIEEKTEAEEDVLQLIEESEAGGKKAEEQTYEIDEEEGRKSVYDQKNDIETLPMLKEELGIIQDHEISDQSVEERTEEEVYPKEILDFLPGAAEEMSELEETEQKQEIEERGVTEDEALSESAAKISSLGIGALTLGGLTAALSSNDEKAEKEQKEREEREEAEKVEQEKKEKEAQEKREKEEKEKAEKEAQEKEQREKEAQEKREKEEKEREEREEAERAEKERKEKEAQEQKEEKEREEREEAERAEKERKEKEAQEQKEREEREKAEKEKAEKEAQEQVEKERREREEQEQKEREEREEAEKEEERKEQEEKEEERQAQEIQEKKEKAEQEEREREEEQEAQEKTEQEEKEAREKTEPKIEQPAEETKTREAEKQDIDIGGKKYAVTYIDIPLSK